VLLNDSADEAGGIALQARGNLRREGGRRVCLGHVDILPCEPPWRAHEIHQCWIWGC